MISCLPETGSLSAFKKKKKQAIKGYKPVTISLLFVTLLLYFHNLTLNAVLLTYQKGKRSAKFFYTRIFRKGNREITPLERVF